MSTRDGRSSSATLLGNPKLRGYVSQGLLASVLLGLVAAAIHNASEGLREANIASGFGFLSHQSGFAINQTFIDYTPSVSTYWDAFSVGLINTLIVAAAAIVLATIIGFTVGIARLSQNWIVAKTARLYVEILRNMPLLLILFLWYNAVLKPLPGPRQSLQPVEGVYLNNRGLFLPRLIMKDGADLVFYTLAFACLAAIGFGIWARRERERSGRRYPTASIGSALIFGLPVLVSLATGVPFSLDYPALKGLSLTGGFQILPEFVALLIGLSTYMATFIAEIVRAGILGVSNGQTEAANALGLSRAQALRHVVVPQAMRLIIPPLTSQYVNLAKNSSLAVAIGYPDLVQVFMGTVLNQTGQAIEIVAITMAVYLAISLTTSALMNLYNRSVALVER